MAKTVLLPGGEAVPALGVGTWNMGDRRRTRGEEIKALAAAVDLGLTLVDTAEMYGSGAAEELVAEAIGHRRDEIFLVTKVLPHHATTRGTIAACEASLRRLKTDRIDLYLLHWRGRVPLEETIGAFETLQRNGQIRYWGVSNFDLADMEDLLRVSHRSPRPSTNQVLYNLTRRGIEYDLLPWSRDRGVPLMAYSPLEQGALADHTALRRIASRVGATASQIALAWVLRQPGMIAVPKTGSVSRMRENAGALQVELTAEDFAEIDAAFPPPARKKALEMI